MGALNKRLLPISTLAILICITACSSNNNAHVQVVDKTTTYNQRVKTSEVPRVGKVVQSSATYTPTARGQYTVKQGETLYSLAFNYGKDWRELAAANNIQSPYTIYPGQVIYLDGKAVSSTTTNTHSSGSVKVTTTQTKASTTTKAPATSSTQTPTKTTPTVKTTTAVVGGWTWPAMGTVIGTFSPTGTLNKGVDISAAEGTPVMAAATGTVVYAGDNLHGYGNLLIIKHNDSYVSAYAHNRQLLVKEGQKVSVGQKIAEMGSTGADRVKLHFEIRLNGKPVDPLKYLPKK